MACADATAMPCQEHRCRFMATGVCSDFVVRLLQRLCDAQPHRVCQYTDDCHYLLLSKEIAQKNAKNARQKNVNESSKLPRVAQFYTVLHNRPDPAVYARKLGTAGPVFVALLPSR